MMPLPIETRQRIETVIEELVGLLDLVDGDADLEANGDEEDGHEDDLEPSIGALGRWMDGRLEYDLEADDADDEESDPGEDGGDFEPSLGWTSSGLMAGDADLELDPCDQGEPEDGR
jgi:hypothetical protein